MLLAKLIGTYMQLCPLRDDEGWCHPTWLELAERLSGTRRSLRRHLAVLARFGLIEGLESDHRSVSFRLVPLMGMRSDGYPPR